MSFPHEKCKDNQFYNLESKRCAKNNALTLKNQKKKHGDKFIIKIKKLGGKEIKVGGKEEDIKEYFILVRNANKCTKKCTKKGKVCFIKDEKNERGKNVAKAKCVDENSKRVKNKSYLSVGKNKIYGVESELKKLKEILGGKFVEANVVSSAASDDEEAPPKKEKTPPKKVVIELKPSKGCVISKKCPADKKCKADTGRCVLPKSVAKLDKIVVEGFEIYGEKDYLDALESTLQESKKKHVEFIVEKEKSKGLNDEEKKEKEKETNVVSKEEKSKGSSDEEVEKRVFTDEEKGKEKEGPIKKLSPKKSPLKKKKDVPDAVFKKEELQKFFEKCIGNEL